MPLSEPGTVVIAGATGDLGERIAKALVAQGAQVRALVRRSTGSERGLDLTALGVVVVEVDFDKPAEITAACKGAVCVVSALSGLADVIVDLQGRLLDAAVAAGVPRFIPSDFSIDYTGLPPGSNRNFDLRQAFRRRLDAAPIRATSIFNGAFADMLAGQMPLVVRPMRRVLFWQDADRTFALTTKDDTAAFAAAAALDPDAPRNLHVAGSEASARTLAAAMSRVTGRPYRPMRVGSLRSLSGVIAVVRRLFPQSGAVFPAWQGMQYMHNMFSGLAPSAPTDNARYGPMRWTTVEEVLDRYNKPPLRRD